MIKRKIMDQTPLINLCLPMIVECYKVRILICVFYRQNLLLLHFSFTYNIEGVFDGYRVSVQVYLANVFAAIRSIYLKIDINVNNIYLQV